MSSMEGGHHGHDDHGHGHESSEGLFSKHKGIMQLALAPLKAAGIALATMTIGPALFAAMGIFIPPYILPSLGMSAVMAYLVQNFGGTGEKKKEAHGGHDGHH